MISRSTAISFALQGILIAGLVAVGTEVYQLKLDAGGGGDVAVVEAHADAALHRVPLAELGASENWKVPMAPDPLQGLARRMDKIEGQITLLGALVDRVSPAEIRGSPPGGERAGEAPAELAARADLSARFDAEAATSRWGNAAAAAIEDAYLTASATSPFFVEHGGNVLTDCRESVCSLSWSPSSQAVSQFSNDEKAELLARAKWELLSLAGEAKEGGQVRIFMDPASDPPAVELMIAHAEGGDANPPDKVSAYVGLSDGVSKGVSQ
jgi:hypothetical protein